MNEVTRGGERRAPVGKGDSMLPLMLFFPLSLFYCELVVRLSTYGKPEPMQLFYIFLLSMAGGFLLSGILSLIKNRTAVRVTAVTLSFLLGVIFSSQIVYFSIFGNYYNWGDIGMAGEAISSFSATFFRGLRDSLLYLLLVFLPSVLLAVFNGRMTRYPMRRLSYLVPMTLFAACALFFTVPSFLLAADRDFGGFLYYYNYPTDRETYLDFGVLTASRLNIEKLLFGEKEGGLYIDPVETVDNSIFGEVSGEETRPGPTESSSGEETTGSEGSETEAPPKPVEYGDNVLDIDFASLIENAPNKTIKSMHEYFSARTPTKKNEYTGFFEGKNLIFLTLEGFSAQVIDPVRTPTLYKMAHEGFVFNNYYCSCWGGSTSTGEYANLTGNFYNSTKAMTQYGAKNYEPFTLGNQFKKLGYATYAFHGHTYTYYNRDESHPNFGYTYYGVGNGLEKMTDSEGNTMKVMWPNSDLEVAKVSIGQYIDKTPFHVYYMSISGHTEYNFIGNNMAKRHRNDVTDIEGSTAVKAYYACQLEVELMVKELVDQLDAAGILEDTVFVMAPDHYPYGLKTALAEFYGVEEEGVYGNFELYHTALIIWSASMKEPVVVDTPCSAIDILPTVSNLFALDYDSRLMMGTDIFSDQDPLVILNCDQTGPSWNWINRFGVYNSAKGFTLSPGYTVDKKELDTYIKNMNNTVKQMRSFAYKIVTEDYYSYVFGKK